ncbi:sulfate adenylyltransferase subunit 1 [Cellulomonas oligotrophica]|uniref:sulfate adenylyltransferase n=1 Tax=Cellulomonas oligotrophica TaxID=931536 RepID=A0A7Y9FC39_9CELL|nr:GTP-binding protein [Cellulomonas oligotrophica]NYD84594.1 sulfate adenylyltransferase subunit 1 [Cellulomonas oligotrophica]GIG31661.1 sulfate adenylyltransferase subunit 1 [Cellulomonas oligotrophica]
MSTTTDRTAAPTTPTTDHARRDLLRLATAGSVDDGKSTLIGRLLYDTKSVLADQLAAVERATLARGGDQVDLALLTDGLRAEREQGITIDVAYRYFSTARRAFVLADTPGHVQYTRNMVTGASTAELAIVLVDARKGVLEQTRRHAALTALLGVPHVVLAVNKMDLVGFDAATFRSIAAEFADYARVVGLPDVAAVPVSALDGDNVVDRSARTPWYDGPTLLELLEQVPVRRDATTEPLRLPVQYVIRPRTPEHPDYRGYAGKVASGVVRVGDDVRVLPSGRTSRVVGIDTFDGPLDVADAPRSVTVRLADDVDVARGDVLVPADEEVHVGQDLVGTVCWLTERRSVLGQRVLVRVGTRTVRGLLREVDARLDVDTLTVQVWDPVDTVRTLDAADTDDAAPRALGLNAIGRVHVRLAEPVPLDDYATHRRTGGFLLVDPSDGSTLAAGMAGPTLLDRLAPVPADTRDDDWLAGAGI